MNKRGLSPIDLQTYQHTYDYQNGRYNRTGEVMIPRVISRSSWWHPFWLRLNGVHPSGKGKQDKKM